MKTPITELFGITEPIIQAPMAGTSTPELAAAVSNAGGLGSMGLASHSAEQAEKDITFVKSNSNQPFNVNFFVNRTPEQDREKEARWLGHLHRYFDELGVEAPAELSTTAVSFNDDDAMLDAILAARPPILSFHLGLPSKSRIEALKSYDPIMIASATTVAEARAVEAAGMHAVVAQGFEAGGHRGVFDERDGDKQIGTMALVPMIASAVSIPVIAAGGIADGRGIAAALALGAGAAQLGTAFITCPESAASDKYRAGVLSDRAAYSETTEVISGRPARGLVNRLMREMKANLEDKPDFQITYTATKALQVAEAAGPGTDFTTMWAGQAASLNRPMPAGQLLEKLSAELHAELDRLAALRTS